MPFLLSDLSLLRDYFKIFPGNNQRIYTTYRGNVPRLLRLRGRASVTLCVQESLLCSQDPQCCRRGVLWLQDCCEHSPGTAAPTPSQGGLAPHWGLEPPGPDLEPNPNQQEKVPAGAGKRQGTSRSSLGVTEQEQLLLFITLAIIDADIPTYNWCPTVCPGSFGHQAHLGSPQPLGKN